MIFVCISKVLITGTEIFIGTCMVKFMIYQINFLWRFKIWFNINTAYRVIFTPCYFRPLPFRSWVYVERSGSKTLDLGRWFSSNSWHFRILNKMHCSLGHLKWAYEFLIYSIFVLLSFKWKLDTNTFYTTYIQIWTQKNGSLLGKS